MHKKDLSEAAKTASRTAAEGDKKDAAAGSGSGKPARNDASKTAALKKVMEPVFSEFDSLFKSLADK